MREDLWSEGDVSRLRRLFAAGNGPSAIARALGRTRNAVIGRLNRMGLRCRPDVARLAHQQAMMARRTVAKVAAARPKARPSKPPPPVTAPLPPVQVLAEPKSITDVGHRQCRFIGARPELVTLDTPIYCGAPTERGSWCPEHRARVFDRLPVRTA